jgi:hypothetical protein
MHPLGKADLDLFSFNLNAAIEPIKLRLAAQLQAAATARLTGGTSTQESQSCPKQ